MNQLAKKLGLRISELRRQRGMTSEKLAYENGISKGYLSDLENGKKLPSLKMLEQLARALNFDLHDFFPPPQVKSLKSADDPRILPYSGKSKSPPGHVPFFPLKIAAGFFSGQSEWAQTEPAGWVQTNYKNSAKNYFAAYVFGQSMEPTIPDGSLCLFALYQGGSRQGKIFLIQARGLKNKETGESFVIKKYIRQTPTRQYENQDHTIVHLISENPKYKPIILENLPEDEIQTIAELIKVL